MSTTVELFERFKQHLEVRSDHAAGRILGVKPQTISNWRTRGSQAEPKLIDSMCRKLGEDPTPWLLRAQAEQAHDPANGLVWKRLATRLGVPLSAAIMLIDAGADAVSGGLASSGGFGNLFAGLGNVLAMPVGQVLSALSFGMM